MILDYWTNKPIKCPKCNVFGNFADHGSYKRNLISTDKTSRIEVARIKCLNCNRTHALIPDDVIPYRQYSIEFISELADAKLNGMSNSQVREKYNVCESTRHRLTNIAMIDLAFYLKTLTQLALITIKLKGRRVIEIARKFLDEYHRKFCQHIRLNNMPTWEHHKEFDFP